MKKLISVILSLVLCSLLIPAVAENASLAGVWYVTRAEVSGAEVQVVDPDAIKLTVSEDGTFTMATGNYGQIQSGTWALEGSVLSLTVGEETIAFGISGDELVMDMNGAVVYLSRTLSESVALPIIFLADSLEAFDGTWIPAAQISSGLYMPISAETAAGSKLVIENGRISVLYDDGTGQFVESGVYEGAYEDGIMNAEDNSFMPTKISVSLREDGSLFFDSAIMMGEDVAMEMTIVYVREGAAEAAD